MTVYISYDCQNSTYNIIGEYGDCLHYTSDVNELPSWLESHGYKPTDNELIYIK